MKKLILILLFLPTLTFASSWECINRAAFTCNTWKMNVPNGWIIASDNPGGGEHGYQMIFISDEKHEWNN